METIKIIIWLVASYLIGSIPFGLIVSKLLFHADLRKLGSGNIGATNVLRNFGLQPFVAVMLLDMSKGFIAVAVAKASGFSNSWALLAGLFSIVGHNWSLYLGFKGGKGIATSAGVIIAAFPYQVIIAVVGIFLLGAALTRYMSVGSISAAFAFPIATYIYFMHKLDAYWANLALAILASAFAIYKHRENIKRLMEGTEPKISKGKKGRKLEDRSSGRGELGDRHFFPPR